MREALGLSRACGRCSYDPVQERQSRRETTLTHQQKGGIVQSVRIGRLDGKSSFVAGKSFLLPSHLLLQNAEIEPRVRKVGAPLERLPIGYLRLARPSELVQDIAEVERNDCIVLIKARRKIVPAPRRLKVSFPLARLRPGERLVSVNVRALEGQNELAIDLSQSSFEHPQQFPPRRFREPHAR